MKYLVTGGAGFIGSHLVDRLIKDGHEVWVIDDLSTGTLKNLDQHSGSTMLHFERMDICNIDPKTYLPVAADHMPTKFDGIFHLAAKARIQPSIIDPVSYDLVNVHGTVRVLALAREHGCKVVFSSSSSVYGDQEKLPVREKAELHPKNPYALTKAIGEQYARLFNETYGVPVVILRYFNVFGERQIPDGPYSTVVGIFLEQFNKGQKFTIVGDGEQRRDFTYVADVVDANVKAMENQTINKAIYNIGSGTNHSVNQVADAISPTHHRELGIVRAQEARATLANNKPAKRELRWKPTMDIVTWIKKQVG